MGWAQVCSGVGQLESSRRWYSQRVVALFGSSLRGIADLKLLCTRQGVEDSSANGSRQCTRYGVLKDFLGR